MRIVYIFLLILMTTSCYEDEELNVPVKDNDGPPPTALDEYIERNFTEEYGMAIRYRFVDNYLSPGQASTPPKLEVVRPMLDFIEEYWIGPYLDVQNGEEFFRNHVPAEIIFLGGLIYNNDGTVVLGTADAGARITFTNVNAVDPQDLDWRELQLQTVYHEFAHTVHQRYKLPNAFETITPAGYTSAGSWFTLTDEEALQRGFVSPYATSSPNEDFAETVAFFLFDENFYNDYINEDVNCTTEECLEQNGGREMINEKVNAIIEHYDQVTGIDLEALRAAIQSRL